MASASPEADLRRKWRRLARSRPPRQAAPDHDCVWGEPYEAGCRCKDKVACRRRGIVESRTPDYCRGCADRLPPERVHIGAVVTARNEGDMVEETVDSLLEGGGRVQVFLIDDASTDGSCDVARPGVRVLRNEASRGVGRSRNRGWRAAIEAGCDVVSFHDAHMEFPPGGLQQLAVRALRYGVVTCSASYSMPESKGTLAGCDLFYSAYSGIQAQWNRKPLSEPWARTPCMMGAGYVIPARIGRILEASTGFLWDDIVGRWGFSEQALAMKCFLLGIEIQQSRDVAFGHLYRSANPVSDAGAHNWRNIAHCTARIFGPRIWRERFRGMCVDHLPGEGDAIAESAFTLGTPVWPRPPEDVFTDLFGLGGRVVERHPDHDWLPKVEAACRRLRTVERPRVLQWRPGEATTIVRRILPDAEITCIVFPGNRRNTWRGYCEAKDVRLISARKGKYIDAGAKSAPYSLILAGGAWHNDAAQRARSWLAPDGIIIENSRADRELIAKEFREKEQELEQ